MSALNVNLKPCECGHKQWLAGDIGPTSCVCTPVLIPCPLEPFREVAFTVRLGECGCTDRSQSPHGPPSFLHARNCPARPIRVTCSISGKTWEESEVAVATWDGGPHAGGMAACRERWALVKALLLNHPVPARGPAELDLWKQRDAAFAALADMARAEEAEFQALRQYAKAMRVPGEPLRTPERNQSARLLEAYIKDLIEQVGALP